MESQASAAWNGVRIPADIIWIHSLATTWTTPRVVRNTRGAMVGFLDNLEM
jgi:hypothetical protein